LKTDFNKKNDTTVPLLSQPSPNSATSRQVYIHIISAKQLKYHDHDSCQTEDLKLVDTE